MTATRVPAEPDPGEPPFPSGSRDDVECDDVECDDVECDDVECDDVECEEAVRVGGVFAAVIAVVSVEPT